MALFRKKKSILNGKKIYKGVWIRVEHLLVERQWSPKQISGHLAKKEVFISHELIYQHIWKDKRAGGKLYLNLRNRGKKYTPRTRNCAGRGMIPNRVGIEQRPKIVDEKVRVGDLELDTIIGAKHKGAIVSIVDRKSKMTWLQLISRATAEKNNKRHHQALVPH